MVKLLIIVVQRMGPRCQREMHVYMCIYIYIFGSSFFVCWHNASTEMKRVAFFPV